MRRDYPELVRLLRAKAASTTFPGEAAALAARADRLAEKYGVSEQPTARESSATIIADMADAYMDEAQQRFEAWAHQHAAARARAWGGVPGAGTATTSRSADGIVITFTFG